MNIITKSVEATEPQNHYDPVVLIVSNEGERFEIQSARIVGVYSGNLLIEEHKGTFGKSPLLNKALHMFPLSDIGSVFVDTPEVETMELLYSFEALDKEGDLIIA